MNLPENYIKRIRIPVDRSKCTRKEIEFLELCIDAGNIQLNAQCTNRIARVTELEWELAATDDPVLSGAIEDEIRVMRFQIEVEKRQGVFQDYGYLKRRIAEGASAEEVYPLMPDAHALAYNRACYINARPVRQEKSLLALIRGTKLIGVLANLITIKNSDLANRLKELLQEFLRM